jgi:hypothetical protein
MSQAKLRNFLFASLFFLSLYLVSAFIPKHAYAQSCNGNLSCGVIVTSCSCSTGGSCSSPGSCGPSGLGTCTCSDNCDAVDSKSCSRYLNQGSCTGSPKCSECDAYDGCTWSGGSGGGSCTSDGYCMPQGGSCCSGRSYPTSACSSGTACGTFSGGTPSPTPGGGGGSCSDWCVGADRCYAKGGTQVGSTCAGYPCDPGTFPCLTSGGGGGGGGGPTPTPLKACGEHCTSGSECRNPTHGLGSDYSARPGAFGEVTGPSSCNCDKDSQRLKHTRNPACYNDSWRQFKTVRRYYLI